MEAGRYMEASAALMAKLGELLIRELGKEEYENLLFRTWVGLQPYQIPDHPGARQALMVVYQIHGPISAYLREAATIGGPEIKRIVDTEGSLLMAALSEDLEGYRTAKAYERLSPELDRLEAEMCTNYYTLLTRMDLLRVIMEAAIEFGYPGSELRAA